MKCKFKEKCEIKHTIYEIIIEAKLLLVSIRNLDSQIELGTQHKGFRGRGV